MKFIKNEVTLTKESFPLLLREAGFNTKKEFADFINLPYTSIINWGGCNKFPKYAMVLLSALIKSRRYDSLINSNSVALENDSLKKENEQLKNNIAALESRLKKFENLKKTLANLHLADN